MTGKEISLRAAEEMSRLVSERIGLAAAGKVTSWVGKGYLGSQRDARGRAHRGLNGVALSLKSQSMGYGIPIWDTFMGIGRLNGDDGKQAHVNKGETAFPLSVMSMTAVGKGTGTRFTMRKYLSFAETEKRLFDLTPTFKDLLVFNVSQTNACAARQEGNGLPDGMAFVDGKARNALRGLDIFMSRGSWEVVTHDGSVVEGESRDGRDGMEERVSVLREMSMAAFTALSSENAVDDTVGTSAFNSLSVEIAALMSCHSFGMEMPVGNDVLDESLEIRLILEGNVERAALAFVNAKVVHSTVMDSLYGTWSSASSAVAGDFGTESRGSVSFG